MEDYIVKDMPYSELVRLVEKLVEESKINPDYNENDNSKKSYIRNRLCYKTGLPAASYVPTSYDVTHTDGFGASGRATPSTMSVDTFQNYIVRVELTDRYGEVISTSNYNLNEFTIVPTYAKDEIVGYKCTKNVGYTGYRDAVVYVIYKHVAYNKLTGMNFPSIGIYVGHTWFDNNDLETMLPFSLDTIVRGIRRRSTVKIRKLPNEFIELAAHKDFKALKEAVDKLGEGGGVSSWNDLTDKPFGETGLEEATFTATKNVFFPSGSDFVSIGLALSDVLSLNDIGNYAAVVETFDDVEGSTVTTSTTPSLSDFTVDDTPNWGYKLNLTTVDPYASIYIISDYEAFNSEYSVTLSSNGVYLASVAHDMQASDGTPYSKTSNVASLRRLSIKKLPAKYINISGTPEYQELADDTASALSIAKGSQRAVSYSDYQSMIVAFNNLLGVDTTEYKIGQNIYIVTLNVPDLWISGISNQNTNYQWVSDQAFVEDLMTNGSVKVGYFVLSALETKVKNPDYSENDVTSPAYIKNRPFYLIGTPPASYTVDNYNIEIESNYGFTNAGLASTEIPSISDVFYYSGYFELETSVDGTTSTNVYPFAQLTPELIEVDGVLVGRRHYMNTNSTQVAVYFIYNYTSYNQSQGTTFPSNGIYLQKGFSDIDNITYSATITRLWHNGSEGYSFKQLDNKFINLQTHPTFKELEKKVEEGGSGGLSGGLIDVDTLPTENIDTKAIYRVKENISFYYTLYRGEQGYYGDTPLIMHVVDTLPSIGEIAMDNTIATRYVFYFQKSDSTLYGCVYEDGEYGWISPTPFIPYTLVTSPEDATDADTLYIVQETNYKYRLYTYSENGWLELRTDKAIIDVTSLPTENINEDVFYRLLTGSLVINQVVQNTYTVHCVETLPEVGLPATNLDQTEGYVYYNLQDKNAYCYADDVLSSAMSVPVGWYTAEVLIGALGYEYKGVITDILADPRDGAFRLLLEYVIWQYKDGKWNSLKSIGWSGTGASSVVLNYPINIASGECSTAKGYCTGATGFCASAEGSGTQAHGTYSHAEGYRTYAGGDASHAEGYGTNVNADSQHVQGMWNIYDNNSKYAHIVGNGADDANRSNAHTVDWQGNGWFAGNVYVGGSGQDDEIAYPLVNGQQFEIGLRLLILYRHTVKYTTVFSDGLQFILRATYICGTSNKITSESLLSDLFNNCAFTGYIKEGTSVYPIIELTATQETLTIAYAKANEYTSIEVGMSTVSGNASSYTVTKLSFID